MWIDNDKNMGNICGKCMFVMCSCGRAEQRHLQGGVAVFIYSIV